MVALISRRPLVSFFVLAFALTWLLFLPWMAGGGEGIPWFTFGPALAGFAVAALSEGWPGVKRILAAIGRWRVAPVWYLVAIGLPLVLQLAAVLINPLLGAPGPKLGRDPAARRGRRLGSDILGVQRPARRGAGLARLCASEHARATGCAGSEPAARRALVGMAPAARAGWRPDGLRLD
jgi:hypothetical protein